MVLFSRLALYDENVKIGEFNNIETNNLKQSFSNSPNNIETSDEISLGESLFLKQDTTYALKKRDDEKAKRIVAAITISATAILGGTFLANSFLPTLPSIDNISQSVIDKSIHYSFDISNNKKYDVIYVVYVNDKALENSQINIRENKHYEGMVSIPDYSLDLRITSSVVAKMFDYKKEIGKYVIQEGSKL